MLPEWPKLSLSLPLVMDEHFIDTSGFTVCKKCNRTYLGEILKCSCYKGPIVVEKISEGGVVQDSTLNGGNAIVTITTNSKGSAKKSTHKKGK